MKRKIILLTLVALLLFAGSALAIFSDNYRLDWLTPLTGGGGGPASSEHYAVNFTVGQTVIGASTSENYGAGLGYWYGLLSYIFRNLLPLVMKN
jgi:hypothetical protein